MIEPYQPSFDGPIQDGQWVVIGPCVYKIVGNRELAHELAAVLNTAWHVGLTWEEENKK